VNKESKIKDNELWKPNFCTLENKPIENDSFSLLDESAKIVTEIIQNLIENSS